MKITEDMLQAQCVQWFRMQYPDKIIFAIPNGEKREQKTYVTKDDKTKTWSPTATRLKKLGVLAGVPDLFVPHRSGYHAFAEVLPGLFIELKVGKNKVTKIQEEMHWKLRAANTYCVEVCYTFEEFVRVVREYFDEN